MYTLTVNNNFGSAIGVSNGVSIDSGNNRVFTKRGSLFLMIPGIGEINFQDLGDKKIEGYPVPKETWGVLVRIHSMEAYYRYEGGGQLTATIDKYGSLSLSTSNGSMIPISLPELTINS